MDNRLNRFIEAHKLYFRQALSEIMEGRKETHWMWFIFPQLKGLGSSEMAEYYALDDLAHAKEYLEEPMLRNNTIQICSALLTHSDMPAGYIFDYPDELKLHSSMTLLSLVKSPPKQCEEVLEKFYSGKLDQKTLELLYR